MWSRSLVSWIRHLQGMEFSVFIPHATILVNCGIRNKHREVRSPGRRPSSTTSLHDQLRGGELGFQPEVAFCVKQKANNSAPTPDYSFLPAHNGPTATENSILLSEFTAENGTIFWISTRFPNFNFSLPLWMLLFKFTAYFWGNKIQIWGRYNVQLCLRDVCSRSMRVWSHPTLKDWKHGWWGTVMMVKWRQLFVHIQGKTME